MKAKTKIDYTHGRFVIATTEYDVEDYREEYEDFCEEMDIQGDEEAFLRWCYDQARLVWEDDLDAIEKFEPYNVPVIIEGSLELWWGRPDIKPVRCESVYEAIEKCVNNSDDATVTYDDGVINVEARHHDGTNLFTITALSAKGKQKKFGVYNGTDKKRLTYLYK